MTELKVLRHIAQISRNAGLEIMGEVLGIIYNREQISEEALLRISEDDLYAMYESFIARAIDGLEDSLTAAEQKGELAR